MWSTILNLFTGAASSSIDYVKIAFFALCVFISGYIGYSFEHSKLVAYKAQVETAGKIQEAKNEQILKEQQVTTERITNDYKNQLARIHSYYSGLHDTSGGSMSSPSNTLVRINGFTTDPVFAEQCATTTAQAVALQQFIQEQLTIK
jgi:hypothetical protein